MILDRYIAKQYLKLFFLALFAFIAIYTVVHVFEKSRIFLKYDTSMLVVAQYILFKIPSMISQTLSVAVLLATVLTLTILSQNRELIAMLGSGKSIYRIILPIVMLSLVISAGLFGLNEWVVPKANWKIEYIETVAIRGRDPSQLMEDRHWYLGKDNIFFVGDFDPTNHLIMGLNQFKISPDFKLYGYIESELVQWKEKQWIGQGTHQVSFDQDQQMQIERLKNATISGLPNNPKNLVFGRKVGESMSLSDLSGYIRAQRKAGLDTTAPELDMQLKLILPLIPFIMSFIGISYALRGERRNTVLSGIAASVIIGALYWVLLSVGMSLGRLQTLPPIAAMWLANLVFGIYGTYRLTRIRFLA